jgi:hypothetical protein
MSPGLKLRPINRAAPVLAVSGLILLILAAPTAKPVSASPPNYPARNTWTRTAAAMANPASGQSALLLHSGEVLIVGGSTRSVELFTQRLTSSQLLQVCLFPGLVQSPLCSPTVMC